MNVIVDVEECRLGPFREDGDSIAGEYRDCSKAKKEIHGHDLELDIPIWCPFKGIEVYGRHR